jgi:hypothetical protein
MNLYTFHTLLFSVVEGVKQLAAGDGHRLLLVSALLAILVAFSRLSARLLVTSVLIGVLACFAIVQHQKTYPHMTVLSIFGIGLAWYTYVSLLGSAATLAAKADTVL